MLTQRLPTSYSFYNRRVLAFYDLWVLGFNSRFVWRCPHAVLEHWFLDYVSPNHCDIGVGTGYFLRKAWAKGRLHRLHIIDGNSACIDWVRATLPDIPITSECADVMEDTLAVPELLADSVSINYLLHCLRGPVENKRRLFDGMRRVAKAGSIVFGSTVLGSGVRHNFVAKRMLSWLNRSGAFETSTDSLHSIKGLLRQELDDVHLSVMGSVLLFSGRLVYPRKQEVVK